MPDYTNQSDRNTFRTVFAQGSRTYFYSSVFFPPEVRERVAILYSFVRVADNFVDTIPQRKSDFAAFVRDYRKGETGNPFYGAIIGAFRRLMVEVDIYPLWVDAFLRAMEADLSVRVYFRLDELEHYMYGSAEVIGLMMARILGLPNESFPYARLLGRAMQYINFLRDIAEDANLGRTYIPHQALQYYGLPELNKATSRLHPVEFHNLMRGEILRYLEWQRQAEQGYCFIPRRYLIPIKTAADMYAWTASKIYHRPEIVWEKKVKPSIVRIAGKALTNSLGPSLVVGSLFGRRAP